MEIFALKKIVFHFLNNQVLYKMNKVVATSSDDFL